LRSNYGILLEAWTRSILQFQFSFLLISDDDDYDDDDNNNNNNNKLQLGCHPVAVVILHVHKYEKK